jgi:glycerol kinase
MKDYILCIDEGTTSTRAIILNHDGDWIGIAQKELTQIYPKPGWVEHNPVEMWKSTIEVIKGAIDDAGVTEDQIEAIGLTNQRETAVVWDKNTGIPVYNAIVWQDRRTAEYCDELKEKGYGSTFQKKTGLIVDPYFSGTKVHWILENVPGARQKAKNGELFFGNVDSWIMYNLTEGKEHIEDYSNASRTMMFNIRELKWDQELLDILEVPSNMLPEVKENSGLFCKATAIFKEPIPITGVAGDQQAGTFGQCAFKKGMSKFTYGTAGVIDVNCGDTIPSFDNGMTTTLGWVLNGQPTYLAEATVYCSGAAVQWLRDDMKFIEATPDSEFFANKIADSKGVYVVPAFTGLGAPYWDPYARGTIVGLARGSDKNHIIRATLASLSYQTKDLYDCALAGLDQKISILKVDGGACRNNLMAQFTADILNCDVERPKNVETTATGAGYLAGLAVGFWKDFDDVASTRKIDRVFKPSMSEESRDAYYKGWKRAVTAAMAWSNAR